MYCGGVVLLLLLVLCLFVVLGLRKKSKTVDVFGLLVFES